jgi:hypothetical protein
MKIKVFEGLQRGDVAARIVLTSRPALAKSFHVAWEPRRPRNL